MAEPVAGIDVASWQGSPNWSKVAAAGVRFAYIKASEGNSTSYPTLDSQYSGARKAGLSVGLYHYARVAQSATSNADALAAQVNRLGAKAGHLPPCLDLEEGTGSLAGWADTFIERLRARTGIRQVMVYSGASFFTDHIGEGWMDPDIYLWIAHYGRPPGKPAYLTPRVAIHQHSQTGRIAGISGNCDLDVAIWPLEKLIAGVPVANVERMEQAWPGGITDEENRPYDQFMFVKRNNVEIHQAVLMIQKLTEQVGALRADIASLKADKS